MSRTVKFSYLKKRRELLKYDSDINNLEFIFRIDLIAEDANNNILTPIPNLYRARFLIGEEDKAKAVKRNFNPRSITACYEGEDDTEVNRRVYIPYRSSDINHSNMIKELMNYDDRILLLTYNGELHNHGIESYF